MTLNMQYVIHCFNNDSFNKYLCLSLSVCTAQICIFRQYLKCVEHPLLIGLGVQNLAWIVYLGGRTNLGGAPTHCFNFIFLDHPKLHVTLYELGLTFSMGPHTCKLNQWNMMTQPPKQNISKTQYCELPYAKLPLRQPWSFSSLFFHIFTVLF